MSGVVRMGADPGITIAQALDELNQYENNDLAFVVSTLGIDPEMPLAEFHRIYALGLAMKESVDSLFPDGRKGR